jgi:hypothetical protein
MPNIVEHNKAADQIVELLNSGQYKLWALVFSRPVFVLCGDSGKAKAWPVLLANERLPKGQQIAVSRDLYECSDVDVAEQFLNNDATRYEGAMHIAYTVLNRHVGQQLAEGNWHVVFM